jgi:hypothetical protein
VGKPRFSTSKSEPSRGAEAPLLHGIPPARRRATGLARRARPIHP